MKGEDNLAWKTRNPNECRYNEYYKKRMAFANPEESLHKKSRPGKIYSSTSYAIKKTLKEKLRSA